MTTRTNQRSRATKPTKRTASHKAAARAGAPNTKQDEVLKMLNSKTGTTVPAIMEATGWQDHTCRAFLSAVVRKRLGMNLVRQKKEGGDSVYRIVADKPPRGRKAKA